MPCCHTNVPVERFKDMYKRLVEREDITQYDPSLVCVYEEAPKQVKLSELRNSRDMFKWYSWVAETHCVCCGKARKEFEKARCAHNICSECRRANRPCRACEDEEQAWCCKLL